MTDKKDRYQNEEQQPADIISELTAAGDPLPIDPETGDIIESKLTDAQRQELAQAAQKIAAALNGKITPTTAVKDMIKTVNAWQTNNVRTLLDNIQDKLPAIKLVQEIKDLEHYIKDEAEKGDYNGLTLREIMDCKPSELLDMLADPGSDFSRLMQAARADKQTAEIISITPHRYDKLNVPLDKINHNIWDLTATNGQIQFDLSKSGTKAGATALFALSFDESIDTQISKKLTQFDKRIIEVIDTGYQRDQTVFTLTEIYHNMGNTGRPGKAALKKINDSLNRLGAARIFFDNAKEAIVYKKYKRQIIKDAAMLYFKRITVVDNGKITGSAIKVLEEPAQMQLARSRRQITVVPLKVLQSGVSMTEAHLKIEDYLLWRISQRKHDMNALIKEQEHRYTQQRQHQINKKSKLVILLDTLLKSTGNDKKDSTGKRRTLDTIKRLLDHYKTEAAGRYIVGYSINKKTGRIEISLPVPTAGNLT